MIAFKNNMLAAGAMIVAGLFTWNLVESTVTAQAAARIAVMKDQSRLPDEAEAESFGACEGGHWPNVAAACLVSFDGAAVPRAARTVTVEYRSGRAGSVLVRLPSQLALR